MTKLTSCAKAIYLWEQELLFIWAIPAKKKFEGNRKMKINPVKEI